MWLFYTIRSVKHNYGVFDGKTRCMYRRKDLMIFSIRSPNIKTKEFKLICVGPIRTQVCLHTEWLVKQTNKQTNKQKLTNYNNNSNNANNTNNNNNNDNNNTIDLSAQSSAQGAAVVIVIGGRPAYTPPHRGTRITGQKLWEGVCF